MSDSNAGAWHPDPTGRYQLRWFDGVSWTQNVCQDGQTFVDTQPLGTPAMSVTDISANRFEKSLSRAGLEAGASAATTGDIMSEPVLVVSQKAKFIELTNEYAVLNQAGQQVGAVREVGQSTVRKALRFVSNVDQFLTHRYEVVNAHGQVLFALVRPAKLVKSKIQVFDAAGAQIGTIVQENVFGKIRFGFYLGEQRLGSINAENWRAWNFSIQDENDAEFARITKTFAGLARAMFTTADNYVVQIDPSAQGMMRTMAVVAAVSVDTALKQDSR